MEAYGLDNFDYLLEDSQGHSVSMIDQGGILAIGAFKVDRGEDESVETEKASVTSDKFFHTLTQEFLTLFNARRRRTGQKPIQGGEN